MDIDHIYQEINSRSDGLTNVELIVSSYLHPFKKDFMGARSSRFLNGDGRLSDVSFPIKLFFFSWIQLHIHLAGTNLKDSLILNKTLYHEMHASNR